MRRLLTTLIFAGACSASVTFPISDHGYTLSLAAVDLVRVDTPMSDPLVFKPIEDVDHFETIIFGANHTAAVLGKRLSTGRWFVFVSPLLSPEPLSGALFTLGGFDETGNIVEVPAFTYHIDQSVVPELFERNQTLWVRSLFHANNGTDPDLTIEANTRAAFTTSVPEPAGLGLLGAGLGALLLRRRRS